MRASLTIDPGLDQLNQAFPVRMSLDASKHVKGYFLAHAVTALAGNGGQQILFQGFGCSREPALARLSALGELHERVWSSWYVQRSLDPRHRHATSLTGGCQTGIDLGVLTGKQFQEERPALSDATGFGFHGDRTQAVRHAVREVLERHLNWMLWNGVADGFVCQDEALPEAGAVLRIFQSRRIPYSMVVLDGGKFMSIGTKLADDWTQAIKGATSEAVMIYESYCDGQQIPPKRHQERVTSLRDPHLLDLLRRHLDAISTAQAASPSSSLFCDALDMGALAVNCGLDPSSVMISDLQVPIQAHCVRAFCDSAFHHRFTPRRSASIPDMPIL